MLSSLETQQRDVKLFPLENPSMQYNYNPELTSVGVISVFLCLIQVKVHNKKLAQLL